MCHTRVRTKAPCDVVPPAKIVMAVHPQIKLSTVMIKNSNKHAFTACTIIILSLLYHRATSLIIAPTFQTINQHRRRQTTSLHMTWRTIDNNRYVTRLMPWPFDQYDDALILYKEFKNCQDKYLKRELTEALDCLEAAYRLYGPENVIGSYNGGKDAVVILHLMRAAHAHYYEGSMVPQSDGAIVSSMIAPRVLYFEDKDEFPEVKGLLHETVESYRLDMIAFSRDNYSFASGLDVLVKSVHSQACMAFVLGTRTCDPNAGSQGQFSPSSDWMPPFMRVNPVLNWTYGTYDHGVLFAVGTYCCLK